MSPHAQISASDERTDMKISLKTVLITLTTAVVALAAVTYVFVIGFVYSAQVSDHVYTVHSENPLSRIGANLVAFNTGTHWVLVDTHLGPLASGARGEIKSIANQPITLAFNSHWHPDHSGGNASFTEEADIVAHQFVLDILSGPHAASGLTAPGSTHLYGATATSGLPETIVTDSKLFLVDGKKFAAVHFPSAHTGGDLVIFAPDYNVVALGDLIWPGRFPFIDLQNGGSAPGLANALDKIVDQSNTDTVFVAGHGGPMTFEEVKSYSAMVRATIILIQEQLANGLTPAEIQAQGLGTKWQGWSSDLVPEAEWIRMVAASANGIK